MHSEISGLQKAVREIPRINRCQKASSERLGHQLGSGVRKADAAIQSGDHFIRLGFPYDPDHLVIHGCFRFLSIMSLSRFGLKTSLGVVEKWD